MRPFVFVFIAAAFLMPSRADALGEDGHRIVCEIAYRELNDTARLEVARLIGNDVMAERFAEACVWADRAPKSRYRDVVLWHFISMDRNDVTVDRGDCDPETGCLFTGIDRHSLTLSNRGADTDDRVEALKFLGHWIGDLHSPFNIASTSDVYGRRINVRTPNGSRTNMRHVWEVRLLIEHLERRFEGVREDERWLVLSESILAELTDEQRTAWTAGGVVDWAQETWEITRLPTTSYLEAEVTKSYVLNDAYFTENAVRLERHLAKAGLRLAKLLNDILD